MIYFDILNASITTTAPVRLYCFGFFVAAMPGRLGKAANAALKERRASERSEGIRVGMRIGIIGEWGLF